MKKRRKTAHIKLEPGSRLGNIIFCFSISLLVLVPIAFSTAVYTKYSLPKFVVLLVGSSVLVFLLALRTGANSHPFRSRLVRIVCLYFIVVAVSALFGVAPFVSLFGSHFNFMGLLTRICFFIIFIALIVSIGASEKRLRATLWAMVAIGFLVAAYAVAQSFGLDPFVPQSAYTFASPTGPILRVCATLGHSNYLGNFLLYTTLVSAGLALAARGWPRLFATAATVLSITAIAFSGTRGAWLGFIAGIATFAFLELKGATPNSISTRSRRAVLAMTVVTAICLVTIIVISPASRTVIERARAWMVEGAYASGRVLLWRDSMKMVPSFALIGCGPEGFRRAHLSFKSRELAKRSPESNNESPHNSYMDAAISYGLPGLALYIAIIVSAMALLMRARHHPRMQNWRVIITGLVSSFAAVLAHNIFIFDQIATGLYFFSFVALAQVTTNLCQESQPGAKIARPAQPAPPTGKSGSAKVNTRGASPRSRPRWGGRAIAACLCMAAATWYSARLIESEVAYKELFNPASPVDFDRLARLGERVTSSPLPSGAYDYLFARAVYIFVTKLPAATDSTGSLPPRANEVVAIRTQAVGLAIKHVENSLAHTLTPELNYSLLGSLALASGDVARLRLAASELLKWDPNNYHTRRLMAEIHLARGEYEQAVSEVEIALELSPFSQEAASLLARARCQGVEECFAAAEIRARALKTRPKLKHSVVELIEISRKHSQSGRWQKAQIKLLKAIGRAKGVCPDCYRELAVLYEKMGRYSDAIAQWETFLEQAIKPAPVEEIRARIDTLKQKSEPKQ